jgi:hypothetical protein
MTWVLLIVLGVLVAGFGYTAGRWQRRAEFWKAMYYSEIDERDALEAAQENDAVLQVWVNTN